jgi:hypothetical protein
MRAPSNCAQTILHLVMRKRQAFSLTADKKAYDSPAVAT